MDYSAPVFRDRPTSDADLGGPTIPATTKQSVSDLLKNNAQRVLGTPCRRTSFGARRLAAPQRSMDDDCRPSDSLDEGVQKRMAQLEVANTQLEAFTYSVSHDLRSPLRAIDGFVRMLTENHASQLDDEGRRMLGIIRNEAQRMTRLIEGLLDLARLGRQGITVAEADMTSLVHEVLGQLKDRTEGRALDFQLAELPAAQGDAVLLRQVWFNLLDNAFKFTRHRPRARIRVEGWKRNSEIVFSVADNGTGFDMENSDRLFGVFQRLHSAEEFEGIGVGLALVLRIVELHGGRVWAEGELDQGACFNLKLPLPE